MSFLKKKTVPANAASTVEDILRVPISSPKRTTPVPPYSYTTWETGIEVYLLEISQTSLKDNVLTMKF